MAYELHQTVAITVLHGLLDLATQLNHWPTYLASFCSPAIFVYLLAVHFNYISLRTFRSELHRQVNLVREGKKKIWNKIWAGRYIH